METIILTPHYFLKTTPRYIFGRENAAILSEFIHPKDKKKVFIFRIYPSEVHVRGEKQTPYTEREKHLFYILFLIKKGKIYILMSVI